MNDNMPARGGSAFGRKIVFFGTSNVALPVLEVLSRKHEILAVVTLPDARVGRGQQLQETPVSVLANEMKLTLIKPEKVKDNPELYQTLQNLNAEMFVVVSYGKILPMEIVNLPKHKAINVHFSLLPKYRGPSPIQSALLNGEKQTGTSVFILDEKIDHGPILAQEAIAIDDNDNALSLSEKMAFKSAKLVIPTIEAYVSGVISPQVQDDNQATHTEHINKAHGKVNWSRTSAQIYNQFRAFFPWPGIWTHWNGKVLKIVDCEPCDYPGENVPPGKVLEGGVVACGSGTFLQIKALQLEGKNETNIADFLNGYKELVGSSLVESQ